MTSLKQNNLPFDMKKNLLLLDLAVTNNCNFRCKHCIVPEFKTELDYKCIIKLFDDAKKLNCGTVQISGGEPFLRKNLIEIAEAARDKGFIVRIDSNGTRIKSSTVKKLCKIGVIYYQVSIYGASPQTYHRLTGKSDGFYQAREGVRILLENGARLILKMTIVKENFKDIEKINNYFLKMQEEYGKDRIRRIGFSSLIYPTHNKNIEPLNHMVEIEKQVELAKKGFVDQLIQPHASDPESPLCHAGLSIIYISADGNIYPCRFFCEVVGNIYKDSFIDIWNDSDFLNRLRNRIPECTPCPYFSKCIRCPALAHYFHKGINKAPEIICKMVKSIYAE